MSAPEFSATLNLNDYAARALILIVQRELDDWRETWDPEAVEYLEGICADLREQVNYDQRGGKA